jgi:hypothetical protein
VKRFFPIPVFALAVLFAATAAWAHDHQVPRANLRVNEQVKRLHPWSVSWVSASGPGCVGQEIDGVPDFRPKAEVDHLHSSPRIVFHKRQKPRRVNAFASRHLANGGYLANGRRLEVHLRPRDRDGHRVWVARLETSVRHRLFVNVTGHWRDEEGCGGSESASWDFKLKRA